MESAKGIPESLNVFLEAAPEGIARSLTVLSAAVSLTDDVALELLESCAPCTVPSSAIVDALHLSDFVVERNSEWHIRPRERAFLLDQLNEQPEFATRAHSELYRIATEPDPHLAADAVPTYLTWPVGQAYHLATSSPSQALSLYTGSYTGQNTGEQWLLGELAAEQQAAGVLPAYAIEPSFLQGMTAYREGRLQEAERYLTRAANSQEPRQEVAIALHILGRIRWRYRRQAVEARKLLRQSLDLLEQLGDLHGQAQVLHTLGQLLKDEKLLRQSLDLLEQLGDLHGQAQVLHTLGQLLEDEGPLRQSLDLSKRLGHVHGQAQVLHTLGQLLEDEGLLRQSLDLGKRLGHVHHQAQVLNTLAGSYRRRHMWEEARECYDRVLRLSAHPKDLAIAHLGLSYVAETFDRDTVAASAHMEQAIHYQEQTDSPHMAERHRRRLDRLRTRT